MRVCVVGLGKIGMPLAAFYASRGLDVVGCDLNPEVVETLNRGACPIPNEPEVPGLIATAVAGGRLRATTDTTYAVSEADVAVVVVPLVVDSAKNCDYRAIDAAVKAVGRGMRPGTLVVIETTLPVGDTRTRFGALLEDASGLRLSEDFFLAFSPERVQSNRVVRDLREYPKIVGGVDPRSTRRAAAFYSETLGISVWPVSNAETAEFTKLAESVYRDVNIALANQLALYAEEVGVDLAETIPAANSEPLSHIHNPGLGVGGHCIPVYPHFLLNRTDTLGLVALARDVNDSMPGYAAAALSEALGGVAGETILVLGLAYRADVKEAYLSPALSLATELQSRGARVLVNDPLFGTDEIRKHGLEPVDLDDLPEVDAVVLHSNHTQYRGVDFMKLAGCRVVMDGPNALDSVAIEAAGIRYLRIGGSRSLAPASHAIVG